MATEGRALITTLDSLAARRASLPGPVVVTSGGFDPLHVGHLRCLHAARLLGGCLVVIVNGDPYLLRKKGYVFMPLEERMEILAALRCVDFVVPFDATGDAVSAALRALAPDIFAKGLSLPDPSHLPEWVVCREIGCRVVLDVGGAKTRSSSGMVERAAHERRRPQGSEPKAP